MKNGQTGSNQNWNISDTSRRETACQIWVQLACTVCFYHFTRNTCIFCLLKDESQQFYPFQQCPPVSAMDLESAQKK